MDNENSTHLREQLKQRYAQLPKGDRKVINLLVAIIICLTVLYGLILPAQRFVNSAASYHHEKMSLLAWMQANAERVKLVPEQMHVRQVDTSNSLLTLASNTAGNYQLSFKRFEPNGENGLRLWLEKMPFNQLLLWLDDLSRNHKVTIRQINIDRQDTAGLANARLELVR